MIPKQPCLLLNSNCETGLTFIPSKSAEACLGEDAHETTNRMLSMYSFFIGSILAKAYSMTSYIIILTYYTEMIEEGVSFQYRGSLCVLHMFNLIH